MSLVILHVDMDSFFVSVERLSDATLAGVPVVVAPEGPRSVVASASYEARRFGVRSAMPLALARRNCPQLRVVPPNFAAYRSYSARVMEIFRDFTPLVEPLSIDEAFLDVSGALKLFGSGREIAEQIRTRVREELSLPASVGVAASKFVAKLASGRAKPDGLLEVPEGATLAFLHPLPVRALWGVGAVTAATLEGLAIHTVADLAAADHALLTRKLGPHTASHLQALARGEDSRQVQTERSEKGISHEETFETDIADAAVLARELLRLSGRVGERLRAGGVSARTISVKLRDGAFRTTGRSRTLPVPVNAGQEIYAVALSLFQEAWDGAALRLIGVRATGLAVEQSALPLWDEAADWKQVDSTVDEVRARFGGLGITRASLLPQPKREQ